MFDFHMHTSVSFDSETPSVDMVEAAVKAGLKEICFTDHWDYHSDPNDTHDLFSLDDYSKAYDTLKDDRIIIRRGIEYGLTEWNIKECDDVLSKRNFDFVIGSVHFVDGYDPYYPEFWKGMTPEKAYRRYLEKTLECVELHNNFDVLGHLTYVCKSAHNPSSSPVTYEGNEEISDEIMKLLVKKGMGMEINTSGVNKTGDFLPPAAFLRRFKELGGEIVTIGSDAHTPDRVGEYAKEGLEILKDIFGYVCTFENRKPIFHKL